MEGNADVKVHATFRTALPADSVAFSADGRTAAVGTYLLEDGAAQTKRGAVELFELSSSSSSSSLAVRRTATFATGAVFDLKWASADRIVAARADGVLSVHSSSVVAANGGGVSEVSSCDGGHGAATFVELLPNDGGAVCCHADGAATLWGGEGCPDPSLGPLRSWKAHDFEAWTAASERSGCTGCVWTGGDDGALRGWDLRSGCDGAAFALRPTRDRAGVTAIEWHPRRPLVAVGGYDESLMLWDPRNAARPLRVGGADPNATKGGGVWRVRWWQEVASNGGGGGGGEDALLVACMHAGFRVFALDDGASSPSLRLTHTYHGIHESLAYGAAWVPQQQLGKVAATCSFYDCAFSVWSPLS